jgi:hypothetical protein
MTDGFKCTADPHCWHPAPAQTGICREHHRQARLAQMRHSPSAAVRASAWLLTQLHHPSPETNGDKLRSQESSRTAAREAEPG